MKSGALLGLSESSWRTRAFSASDPSSLTSGKRAGWTLVGPWGGAAVGLPEMPICKDFVGTVGFALDDAESFEEGEVRFGAFLGKAMVFFEELFFGALLGDDVFFGALLEEAGFIFVGLLDETEFCSVAPESLVET